MDKNNAYFTWRPIFFWSYLAQFFLEWEMFQIKVVEKTKTHILCSITFFWISYRLWDNVEKCCRSGQATDDIITWRMRYGCWTTKVTDTHSEYIILLAFWRQECLRERAAMSRLYLHCHVPYQILFCKTGRIRVFVRFGVFTAVVWRFRLSGLWSLS